MHSSTSRALLGGVGSAALLMATTLASSVPAQAAPAYEPGDYTLTIEGIYIYDIHGTIEDGPCAEVYGFVHIDKGNAAQDWTDARKYFSAPGNSPVEVCEPNRPLREGAQWGKLPMNGNWEGSWTMHFNDDSSDQGWRFSVDLVEDDNTSYDDVICYPNNSPWLFPTESSGTRTYGCRATTTLSIEYRIRPANELRDVPIIGSPVISVGR